MGILGDIFKAAFWGTESPKIPDWVEWTHVMRGLGHCEICLRLDGCWFLRDNKPERHDRCHCIANALEFSQVLNGASAECDFSKIDPYLFDPQGIYKHGKEKMFESWGYRIEDAMWLQQELIQQGLEKYIAGQYELGRLDEKGQRIRIRVKIPRKDHQGTVSFITGWMVEKKGHIRLITPYGDN